MKNTVIHHSADFDGIFCREIARKFLPDAELIGWDFGDPPIKIDSLMDPARKIYVMDLPVDRVFGFNYATCSKQPFVDPNIFVWIDHHKSAIESHPKEIPGYRIDGVAACRLAWFYFTALKRYTEQTATADFTWFQGHYPWASKQDFIDRKVSEPLAVRLAGEYDIFDKRDPNAELFQHGLKSQALSELDWDLLLEQRDHQIALEDPHSIVRNLLSQGRCLQFAREQEYRDVIIQQGFDLQFEGLTFLACNSHELDIRSHLFAAGIKPHHDALLGFTFNGKDWRVSMYHAPGKEHHDLSLIAVKHGGGGHRGACGMRMAELPWI